MSTGKDIQDIFKSLEKEITVFFKPDLIQTGIIPLDLALNGGVETGSLIELSGESQTGKSTLLLHLSKNLCDKGYRVLYIDAEGSVKDDLITGVGLDEYKTGANSLDNKFTVLRISGYKEVERTIKQVLLAKEDQKYTVFIIDSLTALSPDVYVDITSDRVGTEDRVGYEAQLNGRLLKQLNSLKTAHNCIFIFINQTRIDMSGWKPKYTPAGGQAVKFLPDVRLFMKLKDKHEIEEQTPSGLIKRPYAIDTTIEAHKSRLGPGYIPYNLRIILGKGASNITAFFDLLPNITKEIDGEEVPMLNQKSSVTYDLNLESGTYTTTRGRNSVITLLEEHYDEITVEVEDFLNNYYSKFKNSEEIVEE